MMPLLTLWDGEDNKNWSSSMSVAVKLDDMRDFCVHWHHDNSLTQITDGIQQCISEKSNSLQTFILHLLHV